MKTLKSLILFLIAALPVLHFSSCEKVKDLAAVDVVYTLPQMNFTYQPSLAKSGEVLMYSGAVHINLDSLLSKYGLDGGIIGNTVVTSFSITIDQPPTANFDWLQSARAVFSANANFTPSQEVGSVVNTALHTRTVVLTMNNVNIRPYLGNMGFFIRIYAATTPPLPTYLIWMYANSQVRIRLEPLN